MQEIDKQKTIDRYNSRLKELGYSEEALGWTRGNNIYRFEALIREWSDELVDSSICDFGCGFGDFFGFLKHKELSSFEYSGIDINPGLIAVGNEKYPEAVFKVQDIHSEELEKEYDFIFSSGVFNHKFENGGELDFIKSTIQKLFKNTKKGLAINFLSDKVEYQTDHNYNSNPGDMLEFAFSLSKNVVLRNDYMPFEFTIYIRKDSMVDRQQLIFKK